jgi:hypothetical protein
MANQSTFDGIRDVVKKLTGSFDDGSGWCISPRCSELALKEIDHIEKCGEPAPKFLVEHYDSVSFTWTIRDVKIYRCVDVEEDKPYTEIIDMRE